MILRPRYLDIELVGAILDSLGVQAPEARSVRETTTRSRGGQVGISKGVSVGADRRRATEREESFSEQESPVRKLRLAIESLQANDELVQLDSPPLPPLHPRVVVEIRGEVTMSVSLEIAPLLGAMIEAVFSGDIDDFNTIRPEQFVTMFAGAPVETPIPVILRPEGDVAPFVLVLKPTCLYGTQSFEDVEGEMTVLGLVERILGPGESLSLDRWLLPGLPRTFRRMLSKGPELADMLSQIVNAIGQDLDPSDLRFDGPGVVLAPVAIYV